MSSLRILQIKINRLTVTPIKKKEAWIKDILTQDKEIIRVLSLVKSLDLPDCWVAAGLIRSKIWDTLHGYNKPTPLSDIDIIYFDKSSLDWHDDLKIEDRLKLLDPSLPWSVKNQARMHQYHNLPDQFTSSSDAMSYWPETATAIGVKLDKEGNIEICAPLGIDDLVNLIVRYNKKFPGGEEGFDQRIASKKWFKIWPKLQLVKNHGNPSQQIDKEF